ncbi:MAG: hypothetical protein H6656_00640 [Ardenticatenaceae bacterium]|nr:hypothetical protein [Anaerolineales bacterium]MCB9005891.1 hypothetical protein [Ardenticatenaceae bacterium]
MRPMLDELELPQVQEIIVHEERVLAEHKPPGMAGSLLQNMGRRPSHITLWGVATGPDVLAFVENLDDKFKASQPLPFAADIVANAEIEQMVIDNLQWQELAGKPQRYAYTLTLKEYIEPEEASGLAINTNILDEAQGLIDDLAQGLDIGLDFATGLEQFVGTFGDLLGRLKSAREGIEQANNE